jgi:glutathione-regulated potassium-efflux system protein KefB
VVVTVSLLMQKAGLSASLGAFLAGALLAESSYRHQLEADIQPFQGLLIGLFFTAVGMSLNVSLVLEKPLLIVGLALALVAVKAVILYALGRRAGLAVRPARRLGLSLSQGGEFGFVLFTAGLTAGVIDDPTSDLLIAVVTISMAVTPLLLLIERRLSERLSGDPALGFEQLPNRDEHVVVAGFGRFGQIVARVLRGKKIPFIALDISAEQVELVKKFGAQAFFGDASRAEILEAAQIAHARAFVLAIDDIEASMRAAEYVIRRFPDMPIYARARNRNHAMRLLDLGITAVHRETFLSALDMTRELLVGLGYSERESDRVTKTFRAHDERRLIEDYAHYTDMEKLQAKARSDYATLERLFAEDAANSLDEAVPARLPSKPAKTPVQPQKAAENDPSSNEAA